MGEPVSTAFLLKGGASVLGGVSAYSRAMGEKRRAEVNAYIGKTRAINTTADSAEALMSNLATLRTTFAANGQRPSVGNSAIFDDLIRTSGREGRIAAGNDMSAFYDWGRQAANARVTAMSGLIGGCGGAVVPFGDYLDRKRDVALNPGAYTKYADQPSIFDIFR